VANGITGKDGGVIDHIELFGPPSDPRNDSRNFVLCPGLAYDRSPCGTGTSAKLACLAEDGKLPADQVWRQESVIGSLFEGTWRPSGDGKISPQITGRAFVTGDSRLVFDSEDPFVAGIMP
jgi:4-hydroxyproline epimerase